MDNKILFFAFLISFFACGVYSQTEFKCPEVDDPNVTSQFPHPTDCTKFFKCLQGIAYLLSCPDGLKFNANLGVCDWPR